MPIDAAIVIYQPRRRMGYARRRELVVAQRSRSAKRRRARIAMRNNRARRGQGARCVTWLQHVSALRLFAWRWSGANQSFTA